MHEREWKMSNVSSEKKQGLDALFNDKPKRDEKMRRVGLGVVKADIFGDGDPVLAIMLMDYDNDDMAPIGYLFGEAEAEWFSMIVSSMADEKVKSRAVTPDSGLSLEEAIGLMGGNDVQG